MESFLIHTQSVYHQQRDMMTKLWFSKNDL